MNQYPLSIIYNNIDYHKVKQFITEINKRKYEILNYDRNVLCFNDYKNSIYKNVIYSYPERKILSFMSPKTMSFRIFASRFNEINYDIHTNFEVTEFIFGKIINLFYDNRSKRWMLATKFQNAKKGYILKENSDYYKQFVTLLKGDANINNTVIIQYFQTNRTYNFKIKDDKLYLTSIYQIDNHKDISKIKHIPLFSYYNKLKLFDGIIYFPKRIEFKHYDEIVEKQNKTDELPYKYVITHISGMQTTIVTKDYEQIKRWNSVQENIQYMYLCLRYVNKHQEYVEHFYRFREMFHIMDILYTNFINLVHDAYTCYYITRSDHHKSNYMLWAHKIHKEVFIPSLKKKIVKINRETISNYFDKIKPREMLFILKMYEGY